MANPNRTEQARLTLRWQRAAKIKESLQDYITLGLALNEPRDIQGLSLAQTQHTHWQMMSENLHNELMEVCGKIIQENDRRARQSSNNG